MAHLSCLRSQSEVTLNPLDAITEVILNPLDAITDDYLSCAMQLVNLKVPLLGKSPIILRSDIISATNTSNMAT